MDVTRHDWRRYEELCRAEHVQWLRSLTSSDSLAIMESLHSLAMSLQDGSPGQERLERERWEEKLAIRRRMCQVYAKMDQLKSERPQCRSNPRPAHEP